MCAPMIKAKHKTLSDRLSTVNVDFARLPDTAWARQAGRAVFITPSIVTLLNRPLLLPVCLSLSLSLSVTASVCVSLPLSQSLYISHWLLFPSIRPT